MERLTPLRFIAALFVVLFHFGRGVPPFDSPLIDSAVRNGNIAVSFFYCLSGFIMAMVYGGSTVSARAYWIARAARIYPVYLLSLLTSYYVIGGTHLALVLNVFLIQAYVPGYALSVNAPGWSLSVEVFFYALFPLVASRVFTIDPARLLKGVLALWLLTQIVTFIARTYFYGGYPSPSHDLIFYFPLMHLNEFAIGVATAVLFSGRRHVDESATFKRGIIAFLAGFGLVTVTTAAFRHFPLMVTDANGLSAPAFAGIIWLVVSAPQRLLGILERRIPILLGEASYAMYLMQEPIHVVLDKHLFPLMPQASDTTKLFVYLLLLVACSILIYLGFEKPMRSYIRRIVSPTKAGAQRQLSHIGPRCVQATPD